MRAFSTEFIQEKNRLEGGNAWAHLVEVTLNANTTAYFVSATETATWNGRAYLPIPMRLSPEEIGVDGSLPQMTIDMSNAMGAVYRAAKENDLSLKTVIVRFVNLGLPNSGDDARLKMKILGAAFTDEVAKFQLGFGFNFDAEGPKRVYNRKEHNCVPIQFRNYAIIG